MKLIIKSEDTPHYRSHGFGALMNKALRLCWLHFEKYGNWDVEFQDYQLEDLFSNPEFPNNSESYTKDLIWDGDGPKDIEKNRLAFENCFRNRMKIRFNTNVINWIGVHARGTDKATECELVTIETICQHINQYTERIYVATEDKKRLTKLVGIYGERIAFGSGLGASFGSHHTTGKDRLQINFRAFKDVRILSCCKVFLACNSNLSELAMAMRDPDLPTIVMHNP